MKLKTKNYLEQKKEWPETGKHILAQYDEKEIVVYQSYRPEIGNFAVHNQYFGGHFSLDRMTWIKPNFLWMMYRNGWGTKEGQEVVLAVHLKMEAFERYASQAIASSFQAAGFSDHDHWKEAIAKSNVRLQWDPDHDPHGAKEERRAVQIGIRGSEIVSYAQEDLIEIEDISEFVAEQRKHVNNNELENLIIPEERVLKFDDDVINEKLGIDE